MAKITITGNFFKPDETGDENAKIKATPEKPFNDDNNQVPIQPVNATADAAGLWSMDLIIDQYYIFGFTPTDPKNGKYWEQRRLATGTSPVKFEDLPEK